MRTYTPGSPSAARSTRSSATRRSSRSISSLTCGGVLDLRGLEQARGALDVERVLALAGELAEGRREALEEGELDGGEARVDEALLQHARAELAARRGAR